MRLKSLRIVASAKLTGYSSFLLKETRSLCANRDTRKSQLLRFAYSTGVLPTIALKSLMKCA